MEAIESTAVQASAVSGRKRRANQRNARKSTGPRSDAGKERAKFNALKHGLTAADEVVLPHENREVYERIRDTILEDMRPSDAVEFLLVQRLINAQWKLRRMRDAEEHRHRVDATQMIRVEEHTYRESYAFGQIRPKAERDRRHDESLKREREGYVEVPVGQVVARSFEKWDSLSMHEQRLENALTKAIRELRSWRREKRMARKDEPEVEMDDDLVEEEASAEETSAISQNEPTDEKSAATEAAAGVCEQQAVQTIVPIATAELLKSVQDAHRAAPLAESDANEQPGGA